MTCIETLPGPDIVVRVGKVQTKDSSYVRSVASLALLECSNDRVSLVRCVIVRYNSSLGWECFVICVQMFSRDIDNSLMTSTYIYIYKKVLRE